MGASAPTASPPAGATGLATAAGFALHVPPGVLGCSVDGGVFASDEAALPIYRGMPDLSAEMPQARGGLLPPGLSRQRAFRGAAPGP